MRPEPVASASAKFDLSVSLGETRSADGTPRGIDGVLEYASDLFDRSSAVVLVERLVRLLAGAVADPDRAIGGLAVLSAAERATILGAFNATAQAVSGASLPELFGAQAERTPDAVAVAFEDRRLSYAALAAHSSQLAHHLRGLGVGPESVVGLCVERSPEMVIGLLAVLKAGGAYVPLDPDYPPERLNDMMTDAGLSVLLMQSSLVATVPVPVGVRCVLLDQEDTRDECDDSSEARSAS